MIKLHLQENENYYDLIAWNFEFEYAKTRIGSRVNIWVSTLKCHRHQGCSPKKLWKSAHRWVHFSFHTRLNTDTDISIIESKCQLMKTCTGKAKCVKPIKINISVVMQCIGRERERERVYVRMSGRNSNYFTSIFRTLELSWFSSSFSFSFYFIIIIIFFL